MNTSGTTTFNGLVGNSTALASLTTDAPGTTVINTTLVNTTGAQTYGDNVTLLDGHVEWVAFKKLWQVNSKRKVVHSFWYLED